MVVVCLLVHSLFVFVLLGLSQRRRGRRGIIFLSLAGALRRKDAETKFFISRKDAKGARRDIL